MNADAARLAVLKMLRDECADSPCKARIAELMNLPSEDVMDMFMRMSASRDIPEQSASSPVL